MPENYKRLRDPPPILVINRRDPFLTKCCCFSLRTGCFLCGWFTIIVAVFYLVSQIAFLSLARSFLDKSLREKIQHNSQEIRTYYDLNFVIGFVIVILCFLGMISASVAMLYGTYKKLPVYLRGCIFACLLIILLETILIIRNMGKGTATPLECFIVLFNICFSSFAAFITSCYRQELLRDIESRDSAEIPLPCDT